MHIISYLENNIHFEKKNEKPKFQNIFRDGKLFLCWNFFPSKYFLNFSLFFREHSSELKSLWGIVCPVLPCFAVAGRWIFHILPYFVIFCHGLPWFAMVCRGLPWFAMVWHTRVRRNRGACTFWSSCNDRGIESSNTIRTASGVTVRPLPDAPPRDLRCNQNLQSLAATHCTYQYCSLVEYFFGRTLLITKPFQRKSPLFGDSERQQVCKFT